MKDTSSVDLSPSAPPVTNVLSVVEGILVRALSVQKFWQVLAAKGCFDIEGGTQPKLQD